MGGAVTKEAKEEAMGDAVTKEAKEEATMGDAVTKEEATMGDAVTKEAKEAMGDAVTKEAMGDAVTKEAKEAMGYADAVTKEAKEAMGDVDAVTKEAKEEDAVTKEAKEAMGVADAATKEAIQFQLTNFYDYSVDMYYRPLTHNPKLNPKQIISFILPSHYLEGDDGEIRWVRTLTLISFWSESTFGGECHYSKEAKRLSQRGIFVDDSILKAALAEANSKAQKIKCWDKTPVFILDIKKFELRSMADYSKLHSVREKFMPRITKMKLLDDECMICMEKLIWGEGGNSCSMNERLNIRALRCWHLFHRDCIKKWKNMSKNPKCPVCRLKC